MKTHANASSTGSSQARTRAVLGLALAFALLLALAAPPAGAAYVKTHEWDLPNSWSAQLSQGGLAFDPFSATLFASANDASANSTPMHLTGHPGFISKWTAGGAPGTPPSFGGAIATEFGGTAIDSASHNLYSLAKFYPVTGSGDLTKGSETVVNVSTTSGTFEVGQKIAAIGIGNDLTITAVGAGTLTIDSPAIASGTGVALKAGTPLPRAAIYQADGTLVSSFSLTKGEIPNVGIDVDSSGNLYVPNKSLGTVEKYDSTGTHLQTFGPEPGGSPLNDPSDVAVDSSGNVFVSDRSSSVFNEKQTLDLHGATDGIFNLSFDGATTGATFTGDTHHATGTVDVKRVSGTGDLSILASGTGDITSGSTTVSNVANAGTFTVGESIGSGPEHDVIPGETTIAAVNPGAETITLSQPAIGTGTGKPLVSGSKTVENVANAGEFEVGMSIADLNFGFPAGKIPFAVGNFNNHDPETALVTTITAVNSGAETITLSAGVLAAGTEVSIGASSITNVNTSTGAFEVGEQSRSPYWFENFLPAFITDVGPDSLTLAAIADSSATGVALSAWSPTITDVHVLNGRLSPRLWIEGAPLPAKRLADNHIGWDGGWDDTPLIRLGYDYFSEEAVSAAADDVTFHAGLGTSSFDGKSIDDALEALPTIGAAKRFDTSSPETSAETNNVQVGGAEAGPGGVFFKNAMGGRDLPQMTCDGAKLTGGSPAATCDISTVTNGSSVPGRVVKFSPAGTFLSNFAPPAGTYTADALAIDRSSDELYVAGGNSHWAPIGGQPTPSGPEFSVKRYSAAGAQLDEVGLGVLASSNVAGGIEQGANVGPAFGLAVNPTNHRLYTAGPTGDGSKSPTGKVRTTVRAFSPGHALTVDLEGDGNGSVDADHGPIVACATGGSGTCSGDYEEGSEVTLTATDGALSDFTGWSGGGCSGTGTCTVTMNADTTVHATFTQTEENLTVVKEGGGTGTVTSNPAGIDCGPTCGPVAFPLGGNVTLQATEDPGSAFTGWSGGGCSGTGECIVTLNAATTVHATFAQAQDLTVVKEGTGTGSVTSNPAGIDCGSTCGPVPFEEGSSVELTAAPDAHQTFTGWSVTGQPGACPGTGTCTVTMNADTTVHATFAKITHNVSVSKNGSGAGTVSANSGPIACGATCSGPYDEGSSVTLTATPSLHSTFTGWTGAGCSGTGNCVVSVDAAKSVTATFTLTSHQLKVAVGGDGAGTVDADSGAIEACAKSSGTCAANYIEGTTVNLTATPGAHSAVAWQGCDSAAGNTCTLTLGAPTEVKATFSLITHSLTVNRTGSGTGSVSCDGLQCAPSYPEGAKVTLAAAAATGSTFTGWTGAGCSGTGTCTVTIDSDTSVAANFDAIPSGGEDPNARREEQLGQCVKQANQIYRKALKKAKAKRGKAKAKAIKAARSAKRKAIAKCNTRFGG